MQPIEIIKAIEEIAPLAAAAGWDVSGQQVAAHRQDVARLAVCLDPTPASVRTALERGAQFVLSHHPLLLKAVLPNRLDDYHEVLRLLFQADVPLYAAHTSLDVNAYGPAGWLARALELRNLSVLEPVAPAVGDDLPLGFGLAGDLPSPMVREAGCTPCHVDMTIVAQVPKLAPYREEIRKNVARLMDVRLCNWGPVTISLDSANLFSR